jgi:DNA-3-methyladenine glycosylase
MDGVHYDGPGKLTRYLGITKEQNGLDATICPDLYLEATNLRPQFEATPRVGIKVGRDKLWRFASKGL